MKTLEPINEYDYGSKVYGTSDEESDIDIIQIYNDDCSEEINIWEKYPCCPHDHDYSFYLISQFKQMIKDHDPCALECLFLPDNLKSEKYIFPFELDVEQLRRTFSQKSSNSWVKAKKKIDLHQEYRIGMKSLFHSFRILDFGIQIVNNNKITDYTHANHYWEKIKEQNYDNWNNYKNYWQSEYNTMRSLFRHCCGVMKGNRNETI